MRKIMEQMIHKEISQDAHMRNFDKGLEFVASDEFRKKVLDLVKVVVDLTREGLISSGNSPNYADELVGSIAKQEIFDLVIWMIKKHLFPET